MVASDGATVERLVLESAIFVRRQMRTTYGVPGLSDLMDPFGASGDANQGSELKILLRDSNEENRSSPEPELVDQEVVLEAAET